MSVTLAEAISEVRFLLDETTPQFWTNTMLTQWINQGCQDIARQAQTLWMQKTITAVATTQNYDLPTDFLGVHRLTFSFPTSDQTYAIEFRGINEMDEVWGILHHLPAAYPQSFYIWINPTKKMYFAVYPVPASGGVFTLYYYREAVPATGTTDKLDITTGYEDIVYEYAVYKAKRRDRDPTWTTAKQLYDQMLLNMMDKTRRFSDLGGQFTSGVPQWPLYAYATGTTGWGNP